MGNIVLIDTVRKGRKDNIAGLFQRKYFLFIRPGKIQALIQHRFKIISVRQIRQTRDFFNTVGNQLV